MIWLTAMAPFRQRKAAGPGRAVVAIGLALASGFATAPSAACAEAPAILQRFAASLTDLPPASALSVRGAIYVPAYSSILLSGGKLQANFTVTLSVHNTSDAKPLVVRRIAYHDTGGRLVQAYLESPVALKPFGTIEVAVPVTDLRGGTGANFFLEWAAEGAIAEPVAETIMMGQIGTASYAFVSQGRAVRIVGEGTSPAR